jgi:hypothetical protein
MKLDTWEDALPSSLTFPLGLVDFAPSGTLLAFLFSHEMITMSLLSSSQRRRTLTTARSP